MTSKKGRVSNARGVGQKNFEVPLHNLVYVVLFPSFQFICYLIQILKSDFLKIYSSKHVT